MKVAWFKQLVIWLCIDPFLWLLRTIEQQENSKDHQTSSASAKISKGQGYQGFLRKKAGSSFGKKGQFCVVQGKTWKNGQISLLLGQ
jgi:hypothetical protein